MPFFLGFLQPWFFGGKNKAYLPTGRCDYWHHFPTIKKCHGRPHLLVWHAQQYSLHDNKTLTSNSSHPQIVFMPLWVLCLVHRLCCWPLPARTGYYFCVMDEPIWRIPYCHQTCLGCLEHFYQQQYWELYFVALLIQSYVWGISSHFPKDQLLSTYRASTVVLGISYLYSIIGQISLACW